MKRFRIFQRYLTVSFLCIFLFACGSSLPLKKIDIQYKTPLASQCQATLLAGAAKADITPPPGMPMAGHSTLSCSGTGVRNKLKARAIYIKPVNGKPIALVQVDLLGGSRIVHHRTAELVAAETDIDAGGLLIAGTHTHSAPGHYFGANFYNLLGSNKTGFDKEYYEFLSGQIACAIKKAYRNRRPAKIATGCTRIKGVTVNRSFPAYLRNKNIKNKVKIDKFDAVNPYLHLIRVDCRENDGSYKPIAAFSNFSIHNNSPPKELDKLYNADVTAYTERCLENEIKRIYKPSGEFIHAAANHTHADNNPYYGDGIIESFWDFERVGSFIAAMALECLRNLDGKLTDDVKINYAAKEIDMFNERSIQGIRIAKKPKMGCPVLGGAQGRGRTSPLVDIPFIAPGWPRWIFTKGAHGHKRTLFGPLQSLLLPKKNFPRHLFFQVIRVHDTILLAAPWEVTYEMGNRISSFAREQGIKAGLSPGNRYIVVSCTNGLCAYVTTAEEYTLQYYEGAFNLYGPNTGKFIKFHLGDMVQVMAERKNDVELPDKWTFALKAADFYLKKPEKNKNMTIPEDIRKEYQKPEFCKPCSHDKIFRKEPFWTFKWYDVPPHSIDFHRPLVSIEVKKDNEGWKPLIIDGKPVDDSGGNISLHYLKKVKISKIDRKYKKINGYVGLYQAKWYNPPVKNGKYRLVIQPRDEQEIFYIAFSI
ncbi:MAG: neutral/alkaline non-lysosomal ceramidase N-terminal domain-containing protein [Candidatus Aminicenantes bacterium]|jgi:neutral ceramidase